MQDFYEIIGLVTPLHQEIVYPIRENREISEQQATSRRCFSMSRRCFSSSDVRFQSRDVTESLNSKSRQCRDIQGSYGEMVFILRF